LIPRAECKDRFLYRIHSRNLVFGVFRAATGGFIGLRTKFGSVYAFEEYHWENESFATVRPEELLEELPANIKLDTSLGTVCETCGKACAYIDFSDGPRDKIYTNRDGKPYTITVKGEWKHTEDTDCQDPMACNMSNKPIEDWLHAMEVKYGRDGD